jgi:hypothetical protein
LNYLLHFVVTQSHGHKGFSAIARKLSRLQHLATAPSNRAPPPLYGRYLHAARHEGVVVNGDHTPRHSEPDLGTAETGGSAPDIIKLENRRYATPAGLARMLHVTPRTLVRWDERRIGPPKIKVGKRVLYDLAKIPGWLEEHERAALPIARRGGRA